MSKSMFAAVLSSFAVWTAAPAHAQTNLKIGVVNVQQLIEQAPQSKAVNDLLQKEFQSRQSEILAMRQRLQTQSETFQRDAPVMGEEERLNLERQIRDGQRELQRTENEYLEDLNIRRNEELGKLQQTLLQQVQTYARGERYDLVVADVLYFSTGVDITAAVLAEMQAGGGASPPASSGAGGSGNSGRQGGGRESNREGGGRR